MANSQQLLDYNNDDLYPKVLIDGIYKNADSEDHGAAAISKALAVSIGYESAPTSTQNVVLLSGTSDKEMKYCELDIPALKKIFNDPSLTDVGTYIYSYSKTSTGKTTGYVPTNAVSVGSCDKAYKIVKTSGSSVVDVCVGNSTTPVYFNNGVPVAATAYADAEVKKAGYATNATNITNAAGTGSTAGSQTNPVYLKDGSLIACTSYANAEVKKANTATALGGGSSWQIPYCTSSGGTTGTGWIAAPTQHEQDGMCLTVHVNSSGTPTGFAWTKPAASVKSDISRNRIYLLGQSGTAETTELGQVYFNPSTYEESGTFYQTSDETLKTKIDDIPVDFEKLKDITKFIFHWNDDETKKREFGVTAQSLEKVYPELVSTDENTGLKSVSYEKLAVVALAAVDKLYDKQKELETRLDKLEQSLSK